MITKSVKAVATGLIVVALLLSGCLVSGTFVIVEDVDFSFTANTGFYWYPVDLTGNSVWEDHKDEIDFIDVLGMSFDIQNNSSQTCELNVWFVGATGPADMQNPPASIPSNAVQVITALTVPGNSTRTVTYQESLGFISNIEAFKAIVKSGRFDYFGTSCGGTGDSLFVVTNGNIIITVSASNT